MVNYEFMDPIFLLSSREIVVGGLRGYRRSESRTSIVVVVVVAKIRIAAKLAPAFPLAEVRASLPKET